ncbi:hypothetical protein AOX55_0000729 [Sinorhizobium fredii CCBAU 25509]|nr:hypothetical protein AOX55_0000729 [Sinorhizobium fredii CCBAU 25509]
MAVQQESCENFISVELSTLGMIFNGKTRLRIESREPQPTISVLTEVKHFERNGLQFAI